MNAFSCDDTFEQMSLLDQLNSAKERLKPTTTVVVLEDGEEVTERRNKSGEFVRDSVGDDEIIPVAGSYQYPLISCYFCKGRTGPLLWWQAEHLE
ncbi:hypothetical protein GCK32_000730, partial [Trichostrongylus colubriformis]